MSKFSPLLLALAIVGCRNEPADIRPASVEGSEVAAPAAAPASSSPAAIGRDETAAPTPEPTSAPSASAAEGQPDGRVGLEAAAEGQGAGSPQPTTTQGEGSAGGTPPADDALVAGGGQGVTWQVPASWPLAGGQTEFRVATYTLPARSIAGAGECVVYRFPGGGDPQANVQRWLAQFATAEGERGATEAQQAERQIEGVNAWLVRTTGTYITQDPPMRGPEVEREDYALFGAVLVGPGDPVFVKCTGPEELLAQESPAMLAFVDSMRIAE